ncbi:MAG: GreA/GreB family elongation factor [Verrucomicrobiota bacterium]
MSKAFTRESDDAPEPSLRPVTSALPPGVKNYLTADGARRLRDELNLLTQTERPRAAQIQDAVESRQKLDSLDQRIVQITYILQSAEIVYPIANDDGVIRFGAIVTVRRQNGKQTEYRIVGVDETDLDRDWVSWRSPVARALLNAKAGQTVGFRFPDGEEQLEILRVEYRAR